MATEVNQAWKSLTPEQQKHTQIYADNYGEAGAIHHFSKQYHLPDVISLNSSFTLWAPDNLGCTSVAFAGYCDWWHGVLFDESASNTHPWPYC